MTNDIDISLIGDEELIAMLSDLDYRTQQVYLKRILRDTAQKVLVKPLRQASPVRTGLLRQSMGHVTGKSKKTATVFAGPRMGGKYKGYIANILEHGKGDRRMPTKSQALKTPWGYRKSVAGIKAKPFVRPILEANVTASENYMITALRTVIQRVINRHKR